MLGTSKWNLELCEMIVTSDKSAIRSVGQKNLETLRRTPPFLPARKLLPRWFSSAPAVSWPPSKEVTRMGLSWAEIHIASICYQIIIYIYSQIDLYVHVYSYLYIYIYLLLIYLFIDVLLIYWFIYLCICLFVYLFIYLFIHLFNIYIYIYICVCVI